MVGKQEIENLAGQLQDCSSSANGSLTLSELATFAQGTRGTFLPCHRSRGRTRFRRARVLLVPPESFLSQLRGPVEDEGKRRRANVRGQRQEKAFSVRRNVEELARGCDT